MWIEGVACFLGLSLVLYVLLAGADFGAGMVELGLRRKQHQNVVYHALGPVWEANHIWLILVVVILFSAFPRAYAEICTRFHIPLTLVLLGIVFRGCAFTFRHYDVREDRTHTIYTLVFEWMSILTPFFLGVVAGGLFLERAGDDFWSLYLAPWLNPFAFALGAFTCANCLLLASVFLLGETREPELQEEYRRVARRGLAAVVLSGGAVFLAAGWQGVPLIESFLSRPLPLAAWAGATAGAGFLSFNLQPERVWRGRLAVGFTVLCILLGWFGSQYPNLVSSGPDALTLYNTAADEETLRILFLCLLGGCLLIFPPLLYLIRIFKAGATPISEKA